MWFAEAVRISSIYMFAARTLHASGEAIRPTTLLLNVLFGTALHVTP